MAEIIGIISGIIAVVQLTGKLTSISYGYIGGVKRASRDLGELLDELGSLSRVLISLQYYVDGNRGAPTTALQRLNDPDGPLKVCARELEELVLKLEPRDGWKGVVDGLKWPLKEKDTAQFISRIERHKSLFVFALTADQISLSREIEKYVRNIHLDIQDIKEELQTESEAQNIWRQKEEDLRIAEKRAKVLKWLSTDDIDKKHIEISNKMQEGTGQWLLEETRFKEWANGSGPRLLWGYGIPGAGKTFLSAVVVDHFEAQSQTTNYGVAYIYFDYKEQEQQVPLYVITSLVKQLARRIPCIPAELEDLYDKLGRQDKRPTLNELYNVLLAASESFSRTFFVLDALDECDPKTQRRDLLPLFCRMGKDGINLFMTSRPHPEDIQDYLGDGAKIKLSAHEQDIVSYIEEKINANPRAKRLVRQGKCEDRIISSLVGCAQGMFLLVRFHIEYLCQQTTTKQILKELDSLRSSSTDRGLDPTYDRAMENLRGQPRSCEELALKVLSWLVKARRTLTLDEIRVAVSVHTNQYELDELDLPDTATLLDVCAGLVVIDEDTNTIRLAHYTVQEYLLKSNTIPEDADFTLMMACTTYLSFDNFTKGPCKTLSAFNSRLKAYPFFDYAASQLAFHLQTCPEDCSAEILLKFLGNWGTIASYMQYCSLKLERYSSYHIKSDYSQSPLHVASSLGHRLVFLWLLKEEDTDILARDRDGQTVLHKAAKGGHEMMVELLLKLDHGLDLLGGDNNGKTALYYAASLGHHKVVQKLIESGADISVPDGSDRTPLYIAVCQGHEAVTRLLLENGADHSSTDLEGQTMLHKAAYGGHTAVVRVLLENGASISTVCDRQWTALHYAAHHGHEAVIQVLLEGGADYSIPDDEGQTVLHKAVLSRNEAAVRLLLEEGADPSVPDDYGETPLHSAAYWGDEIIDLFRLLLNKGADSSAQTNKGETALHRTAFRGWPIATGILLEKGAPISITSKNGQTALHLAAYKGSEEIVELLLENGADLSMSNHEGQTALHLAVFHGHDEVVRLLLENGASHSVIDNRGETPLHVAASQGRKGIVQLLLGSGADISVVNSIGESVLDKASASSKDIFPLVVREIERRLRR